MIEPRILVVEDDESTRKSLQLIFKEKGYLVDSAGSGEEALRLLDKTNYNLAIVDIRLPDTVGTALLPSFKDHNSQISIIMVTGYASLETAVQALNEGAEAYITKPVNVELVLATIRRVFEKQYLAEEKRKAEAALRESEKRLKVLHELDFAILSLRSSKDIARAGLEHLFQLVPYKLGFVTLFEEDSTVASVLAVYPPEEDNGSLNTSIRLNSEWI
jgi:DNA-binding response OmpR family regulator